MIAAIYSRKSVFTGKGESIENQIELCKEYTTRHFDGKVEKFLIYEDEGFSGGNTNRPKFQELLKDVKENKINILICYRLDRISRNVADFSTTLELLQKHNVAFISIKEQFDTTTPMGRAMVYISSVFAQLERETIAERVRDNMLQLAKTGRWLGGQEPLGFSAEKIVYIDEEMKERSLMKLSPIHEETEIVKLIFSKYLQLKSISQVVKFLNLSGIKGKNEGEWASTQVNRILTSPIYVKSSQETHNFLKLQGINIFGEPNGHGYLTYNKTRNIVTDRDKSEWIAAVAKHTGIINANDWLAVQALVDKNKFKKISRLGTGTNNNALLSGLLKCASCGSKMLVKQGHTSKKNSSIRYDYYVCSKKDSSYGIKCSGRNIRVDILDKLVINEIKDYNTDFLIKNLTEVINENNATCAITNRSSIITNEIDEKQNLISSLVKKLSLSPSEEISKYIFKEIETINFEISNLKQELENISNEKKEATTKLDNTMLIVDMLNKFNKNFDLLTDINQKRFMLQSIIESISFNTKNFNVIVNLLCDKKK